MKLSTESQLLLLSSLCLPEESRLMNNVISLSLELKLVALRSGLPLPAGLRLRSREAPPTVSLLPDEPPLDCLDGLLDSFGLPPFVPVTLFSSSLGGLSYLASSEVIFFPLVGLEGALLTRLRADDLSWASLLFFLRNSSVAVLVVVLVFGMVRRDLLPICGEPGALRVCLLSWQERRLLRIKLSSNLLEVSEEGVWLSLDMEPSVGDILLKLFRGEPLGGSWRVVGRYFSGVDLEGWLLTDSVSSLSLAEVLSDFKFLLILLPP